MLCIQNGTIHTVADLRPYIGDILVAGGKILQIGANLAHQAEEVIDATGLQVYPGLVEAHSHLGMRGFAVRYEGTDNNERNDPITPHLDAIDGFNPQDETVRLAALAGVTTVATGPGSTNVLGGSYIVVKTAGNRVEEMLLKPKAAMKCAFGENPKFTYQDKDINSRMTIAAKLRDILNRTKQYLAQKEAADALGDVFKRPPFDDKLEAMIPVIKKEMPLKAHAHRADDIFTALRIAREFDLRITLEHCTDGHLISAYLARENVPIAVGPSLGHSGKVELRNKTFETAGILAKAGCQVSITTDSPITPQQYLALCAGLAAKSGMDRDEALRAITINPARHLGVADRVGTLEPGKDADIILTTGDLLELDTQVRTVLINGAVI